MARTENPRSPSNQSTPETVPDPRDAEKRLRVVTQREYLALMRERDPLPMTQRQWLDATEAFLERKVTKPPQGPMPPSYDEALLTPGGWSCDCKPLHGIVLRDIGLFVRRTHHADDADQQWIVMTPVFERGVSPGSFTDAQRRISESAYRP